jgi:thiamine pyrophosphokinase
MTTIPERAVIFAGGEIHTSPSIETGDFVIAADSGYDHALAERARVDLLVGDLDSISSSGLDHAQRVGVEIEQHPVDKDRTDLEIALAAAIERQVSTIDIFGGEGGRIGHLLSIALLISSTNTASLNLAWHTDTGTVRAATPVRPTEFSTSIGDLVTLLPVGDASGVTTKGLRWPLNEALLTRGTSAGVSNEAVTGQITVGVATGALLVIHEGPVSP